MNDGDPRQREGIQHSDPLVIVGICFVIVRQYLPCCVLAHVGEKKRKNTPPTEFRGEVPARSGEERRRKQPNAMTKASYIVGLLGGMRRGV